ncbi:MAG TPA: hypothetical protein DD643_03230 [Synechococcus sp. UBA8638]|nr:hypothetical protein [Synechococcus sp. UBA8638]
MPEPLSLPVNVTVLPLNATPGAATSGDMYRLKFVPNKSPSKSRGISSFSPVSRRRFSDNRVLPTSILPSSLAVLLTPVRVTDVGSSSRMIALIGPPRPLNML